MSEIDKKAVIDLSKKASRLFSSGQYDAAKAAYLKANEMDHINFVRNSWMRSYRRSPFAREIDSKIYYKEEQDFIDRFILKGKLVMAVNESDVDQLLG